jgi:hypothetical protein
MFGVGEGGDGGSVGEHATPMTATATKMGEKKRKGNEPPVE